MCPCSATLVGTTIILQGFPGDLGRSLGEDATLGNFLQMLDEHYDVEMTFDALNKELYSLKQETGENVAKFEVCLSQQVQILQTEYLSRIHKEHVEAVKWDCFYEGLSPEYLQMLAHKVWFANAVELYQKKNCNCFGCGSPDHLVKDCPKDLGKSARKVGLNLKEGTAKRTRPLQSW